MAHLVESSKNCSFLYLLQTKLKRDLAQSVRNHKRKGKDKPVYCKLELAETSKTSEDTSATTDDNPVVDSKAAERCLVQLTREAKKIKPSKVNCPFQVDYVCALSM
jgi:hypothetical protein